MTMLLAGSEQGRDLSSLQENARKTFRQVVRVGYRVATIITVGGVLLSGPGEVLRAQQLKAAEPPVTGSEPKEDSKKESSEACRPGTRGYLAGGSYSQFFNGAERDSVAVDVAPTGGGIRFIVLGEVTGRGGLRRLVVVTGDKFMPGGVKLVYASENQKIKDACYPDDPQRPAVFISAAGKSISPKDVMYLNVKGTLIPVLVESVRRADGSLVDEPKDGKSDSTPSDGSEAKVVGVVKEKLTPYTVAGQELYFPN